MFDEIVSRVENLVYTDLASCADREELKATVQYWVTVIKQLLDEPTGQTTYARTIWNVLENLVLKNEAKTVQSFIPQDDYQELSHRFKDQENPNKKRLSKVITEDPNKKLFADVRGQIQTRANEGRRRYISEFSQNATKSADIPAKDLLGLIERTPGHMGFAGENAEFTSRCVQQVNALAQPTMQKKSVERAEAENDSVLYQMEMQRDKITSFFASNFGEKWLSQAKKQNTLLPALFAKLESQHSDIANFLLQHPSIQPLIVDNRNAIAAVINYAERTNNVLFLANLLQIAKIEKSMVSNLATTLTSSLTALTSSSMNSFEKLKNLKVDNIDIVANFCQAFSTLLLKCGVETADQQAIYLLFNNPLTIKWVAGDRNATKALIDYAKRSGDFGFIEVLLQEPQIQMQLQAEDAQADDLATAIKSAEFAIIKKTGEEYIDYHRQIHDEYKLLQVANFDKFNTSRHKPSPFTQIAEYIGDIQNTIVQSILSAPSVDIRLSRICRAMRLADYLFLKNDLDLAINIIGCLQGPAIMRLWTIDGQSILPEEYTNIVKKIERIASPEKNSKNYREYLAELQSQPGIQSEILPLTAIYTKALEFNEAGNQQSGPLALLQSQQKTIESSWNGLTNVNRGNRKTADLPWLQVDQRPLLPITAEGNLDKKGQVSKKDKFVVMQYFHKLNGLFSGRKSTEKNAKRLGSNWLTDIFTVPGKVSLEWKDGLKARNTGWKDLPEDSRKLLEEELNYLPPEEVKTITEATNLQMSLESLQYAQSKAILPRGLESQEIAERIKPKTWMSTLLAGTAQYQLGLSDGIKPSLRNAQEAGARASELTTYYALRYGEALGGHIKVLLANTEATERAQDICNSTAGREFLAALDAKQGPDIARAYLRNFIDDVKRYARSDDSKLIVENFPKNIKQWLSSLADSCKTVQDKGLLIAWQSYLAQNPDLLKQLAAEFDKNPPKNNAEVTLTNRILKAWLSINPDAYEYASLLNSTEKSQQLLKTVTQLVPQWRTQTKGQDKVDATPSAAPTITLEIFFKQLSAQVKGNYKALYESIFYVLPTDVCNIHLFHPDHQTKFSITIQDGNQTKDIDLSDCKNIWLGLSKVYDDHLNSASPEHTPQTQFQAVFDLFWMTFSDLKQGVSKVINHANHYTHTAAGINLYENELSMLLQVLHFFYKVNTLLPQHEQINTRDFAAIFHSTAALNQLDIDVSPQLLVQQLNTVNQPLLAKASVQPSNNLLEQLHNCLPMLGKPALDFTPSTHATAH